MGRVPISGAADLAAAAEAAQAALPAWRRTPPGDRVQYLFAMKRLLEEHLDELARTITLECGKTLDESRGEIRRAIENVEVACGIPILMQGTVSEDIAPGIDETHDPPAGGRVRRHLPRSTSPGMIPFWFMPYALACGNTYIVKPSERVPLTMQRDLRADRSQCDFPKGVLNLVNGAKETVDAILDHPAMRAISFVGSTPVARYIYGRAAANGKRAQCQGGAKNPVVVMPDADMETTTRIMADSAFGCAGQRCLAASLAVTVGDARQALHRRPSREAAASRVVGFGLDDGVQMGPVITPPEPGAHRGADRQGLRRGRDRALVDGRNPRISGYEKRQLRSTHRPGRPARWRRAGQHRDLRPGAWA